MDYLVDITIKVGEVAQDEGIGDRLLTALERQGAAVGGVYQGEAAKGLITIHLLVAAADPVSAASTAQTAVVGAWSSVVSAWSGLAVGSPMAVTGVSVEEADREEAAALV